MARYIIMVHIAVFAVLMAGCGGKKGDIDRVFQNYRGKYCIYISKKDFTLEVYDRDSQGIKKYRIAYGNNPDGMPKLHEGDNRTPEGEYIVNEILSMDADKKSSPYRTLLNMNRVYFRARDGHSKYGMPETDLGDNAYGPRYFGINYPNENDKKRYREAISSGAIKQRNGKNPGIGYGIAIHGNNDEGSIGHRASSGCIRMFNRDILELDSYISIGMPVIISP